MGVRRILDDPQSMRRGEVCERPARHRQPREVDGHDRLGPGGHGFRGASKVDVEGVGMDIDQDRGRPEVPDDLRGRSEGPGRDEDLVAGADPKGLQRQVQACGR